jgi:hypothetical protein
MELGYDNSIRESGYNHESDLLELPKQNDVFNALFNGGGHLFEFL